MSQRAALTTAEKAYLLQRKEAGASLRTIAQELYCSVETARKWWRVGRDQRRLRGRGRPRRGVLSTYGDDLRAKVIELKQAHPHWGPVSILLELQQDPSWAGMPLPSPARLSALFRLACPQAVQPRLRRPTRPKSCLLHHPHQRWQMDAKEGVRVGSDWVTIQELRDPFCGLMLSALAFVTTTPKRWRRLSLGEHQQALRQAFERWGMPLQLQTDHDGVFVVPKDPQFPSLFTLWLVGLGIEHVTSRPFRPTDQGAVERNHRTLGDFAYQDPSFDQLADLQQALDQHRQRYNQAYPSQAAHCQGRPPLVAFPEAAFSGRPYHPAQEWDLFHLEWVDAYLARFVWSRPVMENGVVNLGNQHYQIGRRFRGQRVAIRFLPASRSFRFETAEGIEIKTLPVLGLGKEEMIGPLPAELALPVGYQFPLPLVGV